MDHFSNQRLLCVIQISLLIFYTSYAFFFARNVDITGNSVLLGMSLLSFATLSICGVNSSFLRASTKNLCIFFGICFFTVTIPTWPNSDPNWTYSAASKSIMGLSVVLLFNKPSHIFCNNQTWKVFIFLCLLMILQNTGFYIKENLKFIGLDTSISTWNEKYHSFWLALFLWPIMYCIKKDYKFKIYATISFAFAAIITSYSESVKLAIVIAFVVFFISKKKPHKTWKLIFYGLVIYVLVFPLIFQVFPLSKFDWLQHRWYNRILLFETASNAIMDSFWVGRGFGSSLYLNIIPYLPEHNFAEARAAISLMASTHEPLASYQTFPGNHPHNLVALVWLEFGLFGAIMLLFFIYKANLYLAPVMKNSEAAPFVISLITTAIVLFSLSWSIWQTDVVLTYIMFFACLASMISSIKKISD